MSSTNVPLDIVDNKQIRYRISLEGNPYPKALAIEDRDGALTIERHGFKGPLGQLFSLKYSVSKDSRHLFTVIDGGFSNMPRVALKIGKREIAVFDYGLKRLEMKCEASTGAYTINGNYLTGDYDIVDRNGTVVSSVTNSQCGRQSTFDIIAQDGADAPIALGIPLAVALLRARVEEHLE